MNNLTIFRYSTINPQNGVIELDLTKKEISVFENAFSRDADGKPDRISSFSDALTNKLLLEEIKVRLEFNDYQEFKFLLESVFVSSEQVKGSKNFSFREGRKYPLPNIRILIGIGVLVFLLSLYISSLYILPFLLEGSVVINQKSGTIIATSENIRPLLPIFIFCVLTLIIGLYLIIINYNKISKKGEYFLGTELGLYVIREKSLIFYDWKSFNGRYRLFHNHSTLILEYLDLKKSNDPSNPNSIQELMIIEIPNFEINWKLIKKHILIE